MNTLQAGGSAISYGIRYAGKLAWNLVFEGEDDDGQKGGTEYIDAEQAAELSRLLTAAQVPLDRFLDFMGVHGLPEITVADAPRAFNGINALRRRREERGETQ